MPKRALIERRPWLLASIVCALGYVWLSVDPPLPVPGAWLLALAIVPYGLLAVYAVLRHHGNDTRMLAVMLGLLGLGSGISLYFPYQGSLLLIAGLAVGIGLFLSHPRERTSPSQKAAAVALLVLTPVICQLVTPREAAAGWSPAIFGLALGGMAASAWMSSFPRYRVGTGAAIAVAASVLSLRYLGAIDGPSLGELIAWPLFYVGFVMLATGVTGELRSRNA